MELRIPFASKVLFITGLLIICLLLICVPARAQYTTVTATQIQSGDGTLLASGTMCWQGVDSSRNPISYRVGASGQATTDPVCRDVTAGALQTTYKTVTLGALKVGDTSLTSPVNICYKVWATNKATGKIVLGSYAGTPSGYDCVQPTGATFNFDAYPPNIVGYLAPNPFPPVVTGNLSVVGSLSVTGDIAIGGSLSATEINPQTINSIQQVNADTPGADISAKISYVIANLIPVTGGIIDARGLQGAQSCGSNPFVGVIKPIALNLGQATISCTVGWTWPSNVYIFGAGKDKTSLQFNGPDTGIAASAASNLRLENLTIAGTGSNVRLAVAMTTGVSNVHIKNVKFLNVGQVVTSNPVAAIFGTDVSDLWIEDNEFTGTGPTPVARTSYEIVTGYNASTNVGIHVRNNHIHDSNAAFSVAHFDTRRSDVTGNDINQNNKRWLATGGNTAITRSGNVVTVTTTDTSTMYAGGDSGSTVIITGVSDGTFNGTFAPVAVTVTDGTHYTFAQTGADATSSGGTWSQSGNNDGYGVLYYTTTSASTTTSCHDNRIENNTIRNTAGNGVLLQGSPATVIGGNTFIDTDKLEVPGSHPAGAIAINAGNTGAVISYGVTITTNTIETVGYNGIDVANSSGIVISANPMSGITAGAGIRLRGAEPNTVITSNPINGGPQCVRADGALFMPRISNNTCIGWGGTGGGGIVMTGATVNPAIVNNGLNSPAGLGQAVLISNASASRAVVSDNNIDANAVASTTGIDYRGIDGTIHHNTIYRTSVTAINVPGTQTTIDNNIIRTVTGASIASTGAGNRVNGNDIDSGSPALSVSNALQCNGNQRGVTGGFNVGSAACVISATIGLDGKGVFNGVAPSSTSDAVSFFKVATHATLDLASVASGACTAITSDTLTGAALGDRCVVGSGIAAADGSFYVCNVTATNTAKWSYCNLSGAPIDRASDTYTISDIR